MRLLVKFNAILILVLGSGLAFTAYFSYSTIEANAFEQIKDRARLITESAQTIRDYTSKEITPLLDNLKEETDTFHPQAWIPTEGKLVNNHWFDLREDPRISASSPLGRLAQIFHPFDREID